MPKFQFKNNSSLADRLNKALVQVHVGDRPASSRPIRQFAALAFVAVASLATTPAHANWFSQSYSSQQIQPQEVNQAQTMSIGVIRQIMPATVTNQNMNAGNMVGGVTGGLLGHMVGHGTGRLLATIGGALLGGKVGGDIERNHTQSNAYQVVVHIVDGHGGPYQTNQDILVIQPKDAPVSLNELVYITGTYGNAPRIVPIPSNVVQANLPQGQYQQGQVQPQQVQPQSVNQQFHSTTPQFQVVTANGAPAQPVSGSIPTSNAGLGVTYSSTPPRTPR